MSVVNSEGLVVGVEARGDPVAKLVAWGLAYRVSQLLTQQETRQREPRVPVGVLVLLLDFRQDHVLFALRDSAMQREGSEGQDIDCLTCDSAYMISSADPLYVLRLKCIEASV